jgi:hypothetical protein
MPLTLTWSRTVIGGVAGQFDFSAAAGDVTVGRIYRHGHGPQGGRWFWTMNAFGPGIDRRKAETEGYADSKDEAAERVEAAWSACMDQPW